MKARPIARGTAALLTALLGGLASTPATAQSTVVAIEDARLVPMDPRNPDGPALALQWGDPGSYWRQPGGQVHGDACLSDSCLIHLVWEGPRDAFRPPPKP